MYVALKEDFKEERNEEGEALISHVSKNDTLIIDCGCSHHMTTNIDKFDKLEACDGGFVKLGNDVPCPMKGKCSPMLNDKIRCDQAY